MIFREVSEIVMEISMEGDWEGPSVVDPRILTVAVPVLVGVPEILPVEESNFRPRSVSLLLFWMEKLQSMFEEMVTAEIAEPTVPLIEREVAVS